jgi:predicted RNA-binding Zn ribbon-like protein
MPYVEGVDGSLFRILATVHSAMTDGSWFRLKACRRSICRWAFYDRSRNRSGSWCAMATCGNREKTRGYYQRRAQRPNET